MRIYLAARYSRRLELCGYRDQLTALGHNVQARWLNGSHQISNVGTPIGDKGETLVEDGGPEAAALRSHFAEDDWEDCQLADAIISFTEPPRTTGTRGGRHVEMGIGLALGIESIVIGYRENIFHWLPQVRFFETWDDYIKAIKLNLQPCASRA